MHMHLNNDINNNKRAITHVPLPLPRQEPSTTSSTTSNSPSSSPSIVSTYNNVKTKLPGWQIILIVIGSLLFIGILLTLCLIVRSRINHKRAKSATSLQLTGRASSSGHGHVHGRPSTGGVFDNVDIPDLPSAKKGKRESALLEARVKIRRLIKPRRTSSIGGFTSILGLGGGGGGKKGTGKEIDDDAEESKNMSPWSSNVTRKKSLVIHDSQTGSGLTSLAREQQEREGRYHQQIHSPSSQQSHQNQYIQPNQYNQYSRHYSNSNSNHSNRVNSGNVGNSGRIHNEDNWMLSSDSVAHTIRESFDIVGSYHNDHVRSAEDSYLESPPTTGLGHEVIPLESRLGSSYGSGTASGIGSGSGSGFGSGFGFGGFKFGHDTRKPG